MEHLYQKLTKYSEKDYYPLHMPGHKRKPWGDLPAEYFRRDITEIDGFDNLHQPEGILLALQKRASELYGASESFYLVNGSTGGILSAISAALPKRGHLLMVRTCHKSVYHAAYLRELRLSYMYPDLLEEYDICDAISALHVRRALELYDDIGAVLIVSPTYEGRIADVAAIAGEVHKRGIPLIVDEAHGAHLGLSDLVCENSCRLGADLVIHSTHKTLPALTQTALLHVNGALIDRNLLRRFLHIYQSSSPSYLLMASIDNALTQIEKDADRIYLSFVNYYRAMTKELEKCKHIKIISESDNRQDKGKLLVTVKGTNITGKELYNILLKKYHLQPEMAGESFVLLMFTINDSFEGYERVKQALLEIDRDLKEKESGYAMNDMIPKTEATMSLAEAWDGVSEDILLAEADQRIAAEFVNCYPPGIPILVPGEKINSDIIQKINDWIRLDLTVQGLNMTEKGPFIKVLVTKEGKLELDERM